MAFTVEDLVAGLQSSRKFFLKHLFGLTDAQWSWKPYPECKSITEAVVHLIGVDRAAIASLESGGLPDFEGITNQAAAEVGKDREKAVALLAQSHVALCSFITSRYGDAPLDTDVNIYGDSRKLGSGIPYLSSEDYYHAGQIAFARLASDPSWDYYGQIYGI
jgi:hypothetical protein